MASFTDQTSQFNPYISQLPVEQMVQVGMQKQAQYNQGVQKIQSYIDNIAGIDVIKDSQKQYLQSKLNELGSKLKTVAAGDFSNQQLVNSVGGMATQIVKDPVVQNAMYSTQRVRKEQGNLDAARKNGKSSPENEAYFNYGLNQWLNDGSLDSAYTGSYTEYTDVGKKLRDIADKVHEIDGSVDIPYRRDAAGQLIKDRNGNPIVDDAMLRIVTKGKPAQKLLDNFYSGLDEKDMQQLRISGWYHYRGADKDTFKKDIVSAYSDQKKMISDSVAQDSVELSTNTKLTAAQKAVLTARINASNEALKSGKLEKQMNDELAGIDNIQNLDEFKYKLYTNKFLTNTAKALSYQSTQEQILTNPYKQVQLEVSKMNQQAEIARQAHLDRMATLSLETQKFQYQMAKDLKDEAGSRVTPAGLPTDVEKPTLITLDRDIKRDKDQLDELNAKSGVSLYGKLNDTEKRKSLDLLYSNYLTNPRSITDNDQRDYVEQRRVLEVKISQKNNVSQAVLKGSTKFDEDLKKVMSGEPSITFRDGNSYTPQQLFEMDKDVSAHYRTTGATSIGGSMTGATTGSQTTTFDSAGFLNKYAGTRLEPLARAYVKNYYGQELTPTEKLMVNTAKNIRGKYDPLASQISANKLQYQTDQIAKFMPEYQVQRGTLDPTLNKTDAKNIDDLLATKYAQYNEKGALNVSEKGMFSPETISSWRTAKGATDVKYTIEKNQDGSGRLVIQKGTETQTVPIKSDELGIFFPQAAKSNPFQEIKFNVLSSTNHTTNSANIKGDASGAVSAFMSGYNLPQLSRTALAPKVRIDVEGSKDNDGGASDRYQLRMYAQGDDGVWKTQVLNQGGWTSEAGILEMLNNIGTATYNDVLKSR